MNVGLMKDRDRDRCTTSKTKEGQVMAGIKAQWHSLAAVSYSVGLPCLTRTVFGLSDNPKEPSNLEKSEKKSRDPSDARLTHPLTDS